MKKKITALIGMVVCFMMTATMAWPAGIPGVSDGTVIDGNLIWLQNANCFGRQDWNTATSRAASLKSGDCGLTDGSKAGDWRLPTIEELQKRQRNQGGFNNVQSSGYWSSSPYVHNTSYAWSVVMHDGYVYGGSKAGGIYVWPVRSGQ